MDFHPTSFFILENVQLGTFWVGQAKMVLDECGFSLLPAVTRGELVQKLETICIDYTFPSLDLVSINKNGSLPFYGVERWISKLRYKINKEPKKYKELRKLLTAGWHQDDFTDNSTLNVLHVKNERDLGELYKRLIKDWEARGMRCLNTHTCKTRAEKYQDKKKDPDFLKAIGRKKVLRQMEKTKKLPKPETLAKYDIKDEEIKECMGPKGIIYKISSPSGKVYVGQTIRSFEKRMQEHRQESSGCTLIKRSIDKYGDGMKYEIIEDNIPHEQLDEREIYWVKELNSIAPNGYNCTTGGQFSKEYSQELKDRMRDIKNAQKIEKDGYLGDVQQTGKLFYPRVRNRNKKTFLSTGGFQSKEEAIEVLKEYTKDPENFTIVDNRNKNELGCISRRRDRWILYYKCKYMGSYDTQENAQEALERYREDPDSFIKPQKKVGCVRFNKNSWKLTCKHKYLGSYPTKEEAEEARQALQSSL